MLTSDWLMCDHMITVDKSEAPRTPVSQFYLRQFSRRYFGGDWKQGLCGLGHQAHISPTLGKIDRMSKTIALPSVSSLILSMSPQVYFHKAVCTIRIIRIIVDYVVICCYKFT